MDRTARQELYDRIRASSLDEVVLDEMIRHGFWPSADDRPSDPTTEIRRRGELERELTELRSKAVRLDDEQALRRDAHRKRLADAREKRAETKVRREQARADRAQAWTQRKRTEIGYLGEDVSVSLNNMVGDPARLARHGLPDFGDAAALALAMGISVGELRFLAFDRKVSAHHHYQRFLVPKKTGGDRLISAPMPRLKAAQHWILEHILARVPVHDAAHGFVPQRSIVSNAKPHVGAAVVINLDLADFFPSVTWLRVRGLFAALGYAPAIATVLALLCTEREVDEVELDGQTYFVGVSERVLPQGSPASPALTNVLCRRLDARLVGLARKNGFAYTRYADDLTFSHAKRDAGVGTQLAAVRRIVEDEGFTVHPEKTRVMRQGRRQEVTGVVVNEKPAVARKELRKFRAVLFQIERDGPAGKRWGHGNDLFSSLQGFASYVTMVDPDKGRPLLERVRALAAQHKHKPPQVSYPPAQRRWEHPEPTEAAAATPSGETGQANSEPGSEPETEAEPSAGKKKWWQFWK